MTEDCSFEDLYVWVDNVPLSRRKKNISRDFADAEILKYYFPRCVDLHNYSTVHSKAAKVQNWETLNHKVLKRLEISISNSLISDLSSATPGAAEELLQKIKERVESDKSNESLSSCGDLKDENVPSYEDIQRSLHECQQELSEKEEIITNLKGEVAHLSGLTKLKDLYIGDLTAQLRRAQEKSIDKHLSDA